MANITASDVSKLRQMTGAGMMDCKKALTEADGDFEKAVEIIRKKGQSVANKRADREATEGCVLSGISADGKTGALVALCCETDFVAKNQDFIDLTTSILNVAIEKNASSIDELKSLLIDGRSIGDIITDNIGKIGEKIELSACEKVTAAQVVGYIHPGNKLATLVGFDKAGIDEQVYRSVAMQVAAMNPVAIDKDDVPAEIAEKELEIGREQARAEGKPENILDKIAEGKLNKFYKDSTLMNQDFIKESKITVRQYLKDNGGSIVTALKRFSLND